jgi:hypothetical protein
MSKTLGLPVLLIILLFSGSDIIRHNPTYCPCGNTDASAGNQPLASICFSFRGNSCNSRLFHPIPIQLSKNYPKKITKRRYPPDSPLLVRRKKFIRYQAVPAGTKRYDRRRWIGERMRPRVLWLAPPSSTQILPIPHSAWCQSGRTEFSTGPTTRQYPAIPGNTRTLAHFFAAYCRLTVRVLPRNQFSCRIKSAKR